MPLSLRFVEEADHPRLLEIYSPAIVDSAASFEREPPGLLEWSERVNGVAGRYPWLVAVEGDIVLGYAYASQHRPRAAYRWSVEVSAYVGANARRRGVARRLYVALLEILRLQGICNAFAGITLPNPASVALHESAGFVPVGVYPKIGYKQGDWHDVGWWSLRLVDNDDAPNEARSMAELQADPAVKAVLGSTS